MALRVIFKRGWGLRPKKLNITVRGLFISIKNGVFGVAIPL
jgi:hypothetical protein